MNSRNRIVVLVALCFAGCTQGDSESDKASGGSVPSGIYAVDRSHTYLSFSYLHQGLSYPLLRATDIMGELQYDGVDMSNSEVSITVATNSIRSNVENFDNELASRKFFNAEKYPLITFRSGRFEPSGDSQGVLHGNVTIRGISKPVELAVTFNNGIVHPMLDVAVLGFSATGSLNRSDFGLDRFVPVVSDTVALNIEIEFLHGSTDESAAAVQAVNDAA